MDEEGFSGCDGRTTIFDWWSVASVRRLRKLISSGAYRSSTVSELVDGGLTKEEAEIFLRFTGAIRFAAEDTAISKGTTYDLCWCNMSSDGFDKNRHFAFLRDFEEHTLLIAVNFSGHESVMKLVIPQHAFEWMGIPESEELHPESIIEVRVPSMDGVVIQLI